MRWVRHGIGTLVLGFLCGVSVFVLVSCPSPVSPSDTATRSFDLEPPTDPSLTAPVQPTYATSGLTWAWAGDGGGDDVFRHRVNGQDWNIVSGVTSFTPDGDLLPGRYLFEVQERDSAGNWSESRQADTTIRVREPEVSLFAGDPATAPVVQTNTPDAGEGPSLPSAPAFLNIDQPGATWSMPIDQFGLAGTYNVQLQNRQEGEWEPITEIGATELTQWRAENPLEDGAYRLGVAALSQGGAVSLVTAGAFVIDTVPPGAPAVSGPDTVSNASAGPTAFTATPVDDDTVSGFEWELYDTAPSLVNSGTTTSTTFPVPLSNVSGGPGLGSFELRVSQVDTAGNVGAFAARAVVVENIPSIVLAVATTNPTNDQTPSFNITGNTTGGTGASDLTNVFQWVIDGTPEASTFFAPGAMETPFDEPLSPQPDGTYEVAVAVRQQRIGGSWTAASAPVSITIDTQPPALPTAVTVPALLTNDANPSITYAGEPNATFEFNLNGTTATQTDTGDGEEVFNPGPLADGSYSLSVTATDAAGNTSPPAGYAFEVDITAPPEITGISSVNLQGTAPNQYVTTQTPEFAFGPGEENGATIQYTTDDGFNWSEAGTAPLGSFSLPTLAYGNDYQIAFRQVDVAGNVGTPSPAITVDVLNSGSGTITVTNPGVPAFNVTGVPFVIDMGGGTYNQSETISITDSLPAGQTITNYIWEINGTEVANAAGTDSYTFNAGGGPLPIAPIVMGVNSATIIIEVDGIPYSENFSFTVVDE